MMKPANITRHEIIGLKCEANFKGRTTKIAGWIIDETRNTFVMKTDNGKKTLIKEKYDFIFKLPGKSVKVNGTALIGRPQDRIKKKIEKW